MGRAAAVVFGVWLACTVAPSQAASCPGDCSGDGEVTIDELQQLVGISLQIAVDPCPAGDLDADGDITVEEVILAVSAALLGCPQQEPTPTATVSSAPTETSAATETPSPPATASPTATPTATASMPDEFIAVASDFDDAATWPQVRHYRLTNKRGQLTEALTVATALGDAPDLFLPVGTIVQLIPSEAMVKRGGDFQPEHHGWEYFRLHKVRGHTEIVERGGIETNGGSCYNCHARARTFDYLCETTHTCSP